MYLIPSWSTLPQTIKLNLNITCDEPSTSSQPEGSSELTLTRQETVFFNLFKLILTFPSIVQSSVATQCISRQIHEKNLFFSFISKSPMHHSNLQFLQQCSSSQAELFLLCPSSLLISSVCLLVFATFSSTFSTPVLFRYIHRH